MSAVRRPPILALALVLAGLCPGLARAAFESTEGDYVLASNATLRTETWLRARTVTIAGTVQDDLFALSALGASVAFTNGTPTLQFSGTAESDLWALGDDVALSGTVKSHARLAGLKTVYVSGMTGRNLTLVTKAAHIDTNAVVAGDVQVLAGDAIVEGRVDGDLTIRAQKVVLGGRIAGNVTLLAPEITVVPGTVIGGNLDYQASDDLVLDPGVKLAGTLHKLTPPPPPATHVTLADIAAQFGLFLGALLAGLLFFTVLPAFALHSVNRLAQSVWRSLLIGFATCALLPLTALLLVFTVVGIPVGLMLLMVWALLIYFGKTVAAFHIAHTIIRRLNPSAPLALMPVLALGLMLIYIVTNLPFPVDTAAWIAFTLMGVGAMVSAILDRRVPVLTAAPAVTPPAPPPLPGNGL